jgi:photosystem II stability/assembly factor-like uncharacterized protein
MKKLALFFSLIILISFCSFPQWQQSEILYNVQCFTEQSNNIIVGTMESGIFMSSDYGSTWSRKSKGISNLPDGYFYCTIKCLEVHENIIYAGSEFYGIFLSTDEGNSWEPINTGLPDLCTVNSIETIGEEIFIGTESGVFMSDKNDSKWIEKNNGLENESISVLLNKDQFIYAGTRGDGVYITNNNGDSWEKINNGISNLNINTLSVVNDTLYIGTQSGLFFSVNNGSNWHPVQIGSSNLNIKDIVITGNDIFVLASDSIFGSHRTDGNWTVKNNFTWQFDLLLNDHELNVIGLIEDKLIVFENYGRIHRWDNQGSSWTTINLAESGIEKLVFDGTRLFAVTNHMGIYLSTDYALSWKSMNNGISTITTSGITVPFTDEIAIFGEYLISGSRNGIDLSADDGESWNKVSDYSAEYITVSENNLFAFGFDIMKGTEISSSSDSGNTWNLVDSNLPFFSTRSVASDGGKIYVGADQFDRGLYVSTDSCKNWKKLFSGSDVSDIEIDGDSIFICTSDGIYRSINNGESFEKISPETSLNIEKSGGLIMIPFLISIDNGDNWKYLPGNSDGYLFQISEEFIFATGNAGTVARLPLPFLLLDDSFISFHSPDTGSAGFQICSTTDWSISHNQDWFYCNTYSGSGYANITVNFTKNPTLSVRIDTILVSSDHATTQKIIIKQDGQYLELSHDTLYLQSRANNDQSFDVYASLEWVISINESWCTLSITSGKGDATINVIVEENAGIQPRTAVIKVSVEGLDDRMIVVIQEGTDINNSDNVYEQNNFIYPNLLNEYTTLKFSNPEESNYKLYIIDLCGKICRTVNNITTSEYVLERGDLKQGLYLVELRGYKIYRGKIVVE